MTAPPGHGGIQAEPFFLDGAPGRRFCLYHPPAGRCRGAVLYVHPFAEEMNRARRMAALQARALAAQGYGVLQIDLYGCGDSGGDFGDARWEIWKDDLARAAAWLDARLGQPLTLWGLRLGALLALDFARDRVAPHAVLLWQPVTKGSAGLTQFLRLRMAGDLLGEGAAPAGTNALRAALQAGETLEIAGYDLAPALAAALDALPPLEALAPPCPVHWFEALGSVGQALPAGAARIAAAWRERGVDLALHALPCPPFWTTPEIAVDQGWLDATCAALGKAGDVH
ncbi:hydrolase 2, exosortase A system-associated [uncultured Massilia sp.]|uniref:hydrolase 2, exosortase A system-associated n=1 Tax=uncultured Massilia sp. TaxID=169973 RepID=UPI0025D939A9|nr:hydrolase 2, exosortase A system-associated [uncultured Massilia sp.]